MNGKLDYAAMLQVAIQEARQGLEEGGIPIGAAIFDKDGRILGKGHNRRVQQGDPSAHGETDAFRNAGRQSSYRQLIMVTTLAPCWYCSGLIRQFGFRTVGGEVIDLESKECISMLQKYISANPAVWNEDIGH